MNALACHSFEILKRSDRWIILQHHLKPLSLLAIVLPSHNGLLSVPWTSQAFTVSAPLHLSLSPYKSSSIVSNMAGSFLILQLSAHHLLPLVYYLVKPHWSPNPKLSCGFISFPALTKIWNYLICNLKLESKLSRTGVVFILFPACFPSTENRHCNKHWSALDSIKKIKSGLRTQR